MKYKVHLVERRILSQKMKIQYAVPVHTGKMTLRDFAAHIAGRSSLSCGDIENVLTNFAEEMPAFLKLGMSVQLGSLGTVRPGLASKGVEEGQPFTASHIKGARVIFTPGTELKRSLRHLPLEEEKSGASPEK
ncbi:MAG: DNA-binding protein [Tannerellaceae bacterium]|jgi:predicted histone-like DNA-binding protein|nr:DNA-binding protein [Tannerellaceae bacterium]